MQKVLLAVIAASIVTIGLTVNYSSATHQPADKTAATANDIDHVGPSGDLVLKETMRVSSTSDLILATSAECSILTNLETAGGQAATEEADGAFGQVKLYITIDGKRVPVSTNDAPGTESQPDADHGEIVFCNRAYQRTVIDREENEGGTANADGDGLDEESDFIRTRNANAFNWMAFDVGKAYDVGNDNIVTIKVFAEYDRKTYSRTGALTAQNPGATGDTQCARRPDDNLERYATTCADAYVGSRSLIVEAVHASNHEQASSVDDADPPPTP